MNPSLPERLTNRSLKHSWGILAVLAVLSIAPYANSLGFDFVWDDRALILENPYIQEFRLLGEGLISDFWKSPDEPERQRQFFRPLVTLSYFLDHSLWGQSPAGYHATNVLLHLINVLLLYSCFSALASRELAFVSAAIFAVHPIHTESVTWISGRTDLLASAFVLGSLRCYLAIDGRAWTKLKAVFVALFYLLALLAKEVSIVLPAVLAFHFWQMPSPNDKTHKLRRAALYSQAAIGLTFIVIRTQVLQMPVWLDTDRPFWLLLFNLPRILSRYTVKLIFPFPLYAHDPLYWVRPDQWAAVVLAIPIVLAATLAVFWLGKRNQNALFGGVWCILFLLPVLNAGTFTDVLVAERFLYLPSVGFCLILAAGYAIARQHEMWRPMATWATITVVLVAGVDTWRRNTVWKDEITLFEEIHRTSPDFLLPHRALANAYLKHGLPAKAIEEFKHVLERVPGDCSALNNLALGYLDLGVKNRSGDMLDLGFNLTQRAVGLCPETDELHHTLGEYYLRVRVQNSRELALAEFQRAVSLNPTRAQYHYDVGAILVELGRIVEARAYLLEYVRLAPDGERRQRALNWLEQEPPAP